MERQLNSAGLSITPKVMFALQASPFLAFFIFCVFCIEMQRKETHKKKVN